MTLHRCAMPACPNEATGIFCPDHYYKLQPSQAKWLVRWQIKMQRCEDADTKLHMREQLHGYTQEAVRTIQSAEAISQAAPASARRQPNAPAVAAGANEQQPSFL
ncbi:hypothetical protein FJ937_16700 [Mesorhizobium sp. B2-4-4]|uniref:hypothetical protein n=1 Tax=Mesorhizobium sp. B2-4-4 TaxID=2589945 RepID=UPI001128AA8A|nr:hypothetical protein [Mesorhizobium sp. B2-4-4]TPL49124.1 hypothetical protein FJ937_16700 [Mesorhizobium sp. B2-4-4]